MINYCRGWPEGRMALKLSIQLYRLLFSWLPHIRGRTSAAGWGGIDFAKISFPTPCGGMALPLSACCPSHQPPQDMQRTLVLGRARGSSFCR